MSRNVRRKLTVMDDEHLRVRVNPVSHVVGYDLIQKEKVRMDVWGGGPRVPVSTSPNELIDRMRGIHGEDADSEEWEFQSMLEVSLVDRMGVTCVRTRTSPGTGPCGRSCKFPVPHGDGLLCPPVYTFYSRSCESTYKF